jgi:uncharacterized membrane-anchored protein
MISNIVSRRAQSALCSLAMLATLMRATAADTPTNPAAAPRQNPIEKLGWHQGPATAELKSRAEIKLPADYRWLDAADAGKALTLMGNRSAGRELGLIENTKAGWWVVIEFDEVGFVKDDEKDKLDADKLIASIRAGTEEANKERTKQGAPPMSILGWHVKPNFNDQTKNLEWSILGESRGNKFVNYNVRLLGRKGVTEIVLIEDHDKVDAAMPEFRKLLADFSYKGGESYAEYRAGDKIAQYGLGALVVGGAAAVAYKVGFFGLIAGFLKKGWKAVVLVIAAIGASIKKLLGGRGRN